MDDLPSSPLPPLTSKPDTSELVSSLPLPAALEVSEELAGPIDSEVQTPLPNAPLTPTLPMRSTRRRPPPKLRPSSNRPRRTNKATFLYRFYDADDVLLYVGITDDLGERTFNHARSSSWMDFAVRSTIERYMSRREAEKHEVDAIRAERPLFNVAHNDDPNVEGRLVDYLIEHDRRDLLRVAVSRG